jgi:predicted RNA-binding Zn-ribbon protein involved in translation (DUF1610 family)
LRNPRLADRLEHGSQVPSGREAVADRFIPLKCQSCGAKLDVYDDMTRFACGYCGLEMLVERRGGTVSLKAVEEAIQKVQVAADKTAAELALSRLEGELKALEAQRQSLLRVKPSGGCVLLVFLAVIGVGALWNAFSEGWQPLLFFIGLAAFLGCYKAIEWERKTLSELLVQKNALEARLAEVAAEIRRNREIVKS